MPLPRCVLSRAPAAAAARIVGPSAAVWPRATTTPRAVALLDEVDRARALGGERDQDDPAPRRVLERLELAPVGVADRVERVGAR